MSADLSRGRPSERELRADRLKRMRQIRGTAEPNEWQALIDLADVAKPNLHKSRRLA